MSTIDRLPHVCLLALFNILSTSDLVNVSLTCRTFYKILVSTKRPFTLLDFRCFERRMTYIPNKGIWSNITHVKFLSLRFCVKVSNFAPLKDMVRLISLDIYCTNISGEELCEFIPMGLILVIASDWHPPNYSRNFCTRDAVWKWWDLQPLIKLLTMRLVSNGSFWAKPIIAFVCGCLWSERLLIIFDYL